MTNHRVSRGRQSQEWLAERLRDEGWTDAKSRSASLPGMDVYDVPGLAPEVKATEGQDFTGALRQAQKNAGDNPCDFHKETAGSASADCNDCTRALPFVVYRPRGYGKERMDDWVVALRLEDMISLLKKAGY